MPLPTLTTSKKCFSLFVSEKMSLNCKFSIIIFLPIKNSVILNRTAKMTYCDNNIVTRTYSEVACGKCFVKQCQNFWKTYVRNSTFVDQLSTSNIFIHMIVSFFFLEFQISFWKTPLKGCFCNKKKQKIKMFQKIHTIAEKLQKLDRHSVFLKMWIFLVHT